MEKEIFARFQQKHDIEANWQNATDFIPKAGEIIVYDTDDTHDQPRIKIGNGVDNVNVLTFIGKDFDILPIDKGGTGNVDGYIRTGAKEGTVIGDRATAEGVNTTASGNYSHAEGDGTSALGNYSHAQGQNTIAHADWSHAEGYASEAHGICSHAENRITKAIGEYSHAEGDRSEARGAQSHAEGSETISSGYSSHAEGTFSKAAGGNSHAEGYSTNALGNYSHAQGQNTIAQADWSHAEGYASEAQGICSHAENRITKAIGEYSHAEGDRSEAHGAESHAEGAQTIANGSASHAEGNKTKSTGYASHTEGAYSIASGGASHAEGGHFKEFDDGYHLIAMGGSGTKATGHSSHAEGSSTIASGKFSHAEGYGTLASGEASHASGSGKLIDFGNVSEIIGYSVTIMPYDPNITIEIDDLLVFKKTDNLSRERKVVDKISDTQYILDDSIESDYTRVYKIVYTVATGKVSRSVGYATTATGNYSSAEGYLTHAAGEGSHAEGSSSQAIGIYSHAEGYTTSANGKYSHAEGDDTNAEGENSHAEGSLTHAVGYSSHAEGETTKAEGSYSHSEGFGTAASNIATHAEGYETQANGKTSHAEGHSSIANGQCSHAEGHLTRAEGQDSHSEGYFTLAQGSYSHAEGYSTTASGKYSHAEGYSGGAFIYTTGRFADTLPSSGTQGDYFLCYGYDVEKGEDGGYYGSYPPLQTDLSLNQSVTIRLLERKAGWPWSNPPTGYFTYEVVSGNIEAIKYYDSINVYSTDKSYNTALGEGSHVEGIGTQANARASHVEGRYNIIDTDSKYVHITGIGNSPIKRSNGFTVDTQGKGSFASTVATNGADYAEHFEWLDGNPNNEDRIGYMVTLDGDKIKLANEEDDVIGVISGTAAVLGDNAEWEWKQKYETDNFGRIIYEKIPQYKTTFDKTTYEPIEVIVGYSTEPKLNPAYDPEQPYIARADRPEWGVVGMFGKLYVRDDGTSLPNQYLKVGNGGIGVNSPSKTNMRVLRRVSENIVQILFT